MNKPWVFIAGPYTKPDPDFNTVLAMDKWHILYHKGCVPICPHLSHFLHIHGQKDEKKEISYEEWCAYDIELLKECDALYRFPGESPGADKEVEFAKGLGMPVFTSIADVVAWMEEGDKHEQEA